jgi:dTDP-4-amino-4,6-dideoxygalactose transaminase
MLRLANPGSPDGFDMEFEENEGPATVIGGLFGLTTTPIHSTVPAPAFLDQRNLFFANATSGLAELIKALRPDDVWLPSYLCEALPVAIRHADAATRFYPIDGTLGLQSLSWLDEVKAGDVVVMIDYFGHPISLDQVDAVRARGAWVVEDATQAMLSDDAGLRGDFAIFSPRKFLGVPDGGILMLNRPLDLGRLELAPPPADWWLTAFNATMLRRDFDLHGGNRDWFDLFQKAEANAPVGAFRMSDLSRGLLGTCFDFDAIARRRCANYDRLAARLGDIALFAERPSGAVPLAFPIRVKARDRIRQGLFDQHIYPPVHWSLRGLVPDSFAESHCLSLEVMSLPCDQRYGERDMDRTSAAVRAAMA